MDIILFKKDWARFPTARPDWKTKNKSFLDMALKFKMMGIENHAWPLALVDQSLVGVDPHDPDLTLEQMGRVTIEIRRNPWYYFREVGKAPGQSGKASGPIEANRGNLSAWWCFFNHVTYILTQPRQTGKSFSIDHLMTLLYAVYCKDTEINLLTKDDKLRIANIDRLKKIYEELPPYLQFKVSGDTYNTEEIGISALKNKYRTHVPNASEKRAYNVGRGLTTPILQIDEPPFQPNIKVAMGAAMAAMKAARDLAKEAGEPYGTMLTTTAGKIDDPDGSYVYGYIQEAALWTERLYDCIDEADLEYTIRRNSRSSKAGSLLSGEEGGGDSGRGVYRVYGCFSHRQLGKTDAWLRDALENSDQKDLDADRDYFNVWTAGSISSPIDKRLLEIIKRSSTEPVYTDISAIGNYITRWYIDENTIDSYMANNYCTIGIDTSNAVGKDDISLVLSDVKTGDTIAVGAFNETLITTFSNWLVSLAVKWPKAIFVIENRSTGQAVIDHLITFLPQKGIDPFKRIFNWVVNNPLDHPALYDQAKLPMSRRAQDIYRKAKGLFGFATSARGQTSREALYSNTLKSACKYCAKAVKDHELIGQIAALTNRKGRIDHPEGGHDDLVIGWLLGHWLITEGKNLAFYGIDSHTILVNSVTEKTDPLALFQAAQQKKVRQAIEEMVGELSQEEDPNVIFYIQSKLKHLSSQIVYMEGESLSVDAMIEQANKDRNLRMKQNQMRQSSHWSTARESGGSRGWSNALTRVM